MKITIISTGIKRFSENMLRTLHYNTNELLRTYTKLSSKMYKGNSKDNVSIRAESGGDVTLGELDILVLIGVHCHLNKLLFRVLETREKSNVSLQLHLATLYMPSVPTLIAGRVKKRKKAIKKFSQQPKKKKRKMLPFFAKLTRVYRSDDIVFEL